MKRKVLIITSWANSGGAYTIASEIIHQSTQYEYKLFSLQKKHILGIPYFYNTYDGKITFVPFLNIIFHKFFGYDIFTSNPLSISKAIRESDIINIHILHSHVFNEGYIYKTIKRYDKPVIFTVHDAWITTGRCAIPKLNNCFGYLSNCKQCQFPKSYPSTLIHPSNRLEKRLNYINNIGTKVTFIVPSLWLSKIIEDTFNQENIEVINLKNAVKVDCSNDELKRQLFDFVFATNDFREKFKFSESELKRIVDIYTKRNFLLIGNNPSFAFDDVNIITLPKQNRSELASILQNCNCLIFFSKIDNYPTIICEALLCGCYIICYQSDGTCDVLREFKEVEDYYFINELTYENSEFIMSNILNVENKMNRMEKALRTFDIESYINSYENILKNVYTEIK